MRRLTTILALGLIVHSFFSWTAVSASDIRLDGALAVAPGAAGNPPAVGFPGLHLQGVLKDPQGELISGMVSLTVRVYSTPTGGSPLYAEQFTTLVTDGFLEMTIGIGQGTTSDDLVEALTPTISGPDRYLALQIEPDTEELSPRRRMAGSLYCMLAADALKLDGLPATEYLRRVEVQPQTVTPLRLEDGPNINGDAPLCVGQLGAPTGLRNWCLSVAPSDGDLQLETCDDSYSPISTVVEFSRSEGMKVLVPGTYTGSIKIEGTCAANGGVVVGSPATIAVNLTVKPIALQTANQLECENTTGTVVVAIDPSGNLRCDQGVTLGDGSLDVATVNGQLLCFGGFTCRSASTFVLENGPTAECERAMAFHETCTFDKQASFNMGPITGPALQARSYDPARPACVFVANYPGEGTVVQLEQNSTITGVWKASGALGVGTQSPNTPLHIKAGPNAVTLENGTNAVDRKKWCLRVESADGAFELADVDDAFTTATPMLRVGRSNSSPAVSIVGGVLNTGSGGPDLRISGGSGGGATLLLNSAIPQASLTGTLVVQGDGQFFGNLCSMTGLVLACSDARYKEDVRPIRGALEKVEQLQGVNYRWKRGEYPAHKFPDGDQIGFIAQDVKKVLPELVAMGDDGYMAVDYSRFSALLLEAVKEQQKQIETLSARIEQLEGASESFVQAGK